MASNSARRPAPMKPTAGAQNAVGRAKLPSIPMLTLRSQDHLREALKAAIVRDEPQKIEALVRRGAPLYQHYFHGPAGPHNPRNQQTKKLGMVNPVDWAAMELRFAAAMQILEMGDGRLKNTEVRPRPSKLEEHNLAADTKMALVLAAKHGQLGLIRMLLERGCAVGQKDMEGISALRSATEAGKPEAVSLLLQYAAWNFEEHPDEVIAAAGAKALIPRFVAAGVITPPETDVTMNFEVDCTTSPVASQCQSPDILRLSSGPSQGYGSGSPRYGTGSPRLDFPGYGTGSPRSDGLANSNCMALTPIAPATGGVVTVPTPGTLMLGSTSGRFLRELTSEETKLKGELTRAIRKGDDIKVRGLLDRGAPLDASFDLGYGEIGNCVDWACVNAKPKLALTLLSLADQRGLGESLAQTAKAAFFWSLTQGYPEVLEDLLRHGADVSMKAPLQTLEIWRSERGNQSALAAAVFGARKAEIALLLQYGAWGYESDAQRVQLLEWAKSRKAVAEAFQEAGIHSTCEDRLSPIHSPEKRERCATGSTTPTTRAGTAMTTDSDGRGQTPQE